MFAAGDIANAQHPILGERVRVEHWGTALRTGRAAARNMLGRDLAYERIPYFFSDQYDTGMEYAGYAPSYDRVVFRGDPSSLEFIAFWLRGERVVAGMNFNVWDVNEDIQTLIRTGSTVDDDALRDPERGAQRPGRGLAPLRSAADLLVGELELGGGDVLLEVLGATRCPGSGASRGCARAATRAPPARSSRRAPRRSRRPARLARRASPPPAGTTG